MTPEFKRQYKVEFPGAKERGRSAQTLEDAIWTAEWHVHSTWSDADKAIITQRTTGYRWIVQEKREEIEFQTPQIVKRTIAAESIDLYLTVEEAEALAEAARAAVPRDRRTKALIQQAVDQIGLLCRRIRISVLTDDETVRRGRGIARSWCCRSILEAPPAPPEEVQEEAPVERENLSLAEAAAILGKSKQTLYNWFRNGKFPPAIDLSRFWDHLQRRQIVVPKYRLEAWQQGEPIPKIIEEVFEIQHLRGPPWVCWRPRKDASQKEIAFWVERRALKRARTNKGTWIYGDDLREGETYEVEPPAPEVAPGTYRGDSDV